MGAMSGDLVRAETVERDARIVEGILHLRYVPLGYVQVNVEDSDGSHPVDPASVVVVESGVVSADALDDADPLRSDPGWRAVHDLERAIIEERLPKKRQRRGGRWRDLFDSLDVLVQPLVDAGWQRGESYQEDSSEYGDSVAYAFRRNELEISVEYFEDGGLTVYPASTQTDEDDSEPTEPLFFADGAGELWGEFRIRGWLVPSDGT